MPKVKARSTIDENERKEGTTKHPRTLPLPVSTPIAAPAMLCPYMSTSGGAGVLALAPSASAAALRAATTGAILASISSST